MCITYDLFVYIFQNSFKCYVIVVTARVWDVFLSILLVLENCNFRSLKSRWILSFQFAMNPVDVAVDVSNNQTQFTIVLISVYNVAVMLLLGRMTW